jgi:hypothetical protein
MWTRSRLAFAALVSLGAASLLPRPSFAQRPPEFFGQGRGFAFELSMGEPISWFLEHSHELELEDAQRTNLIAIRRRLRQVNAPWMDKLDSLRRVAGVELDERPRLSADDVKALERFEKLANETHVIDSIRVNNDAARAEARLLLTDSQRATADSLASDDRRRSGERRGRRPPGDRESLVGDRGRSVAWASSRPQ